MSKALASILDQPEQSLKKIIAKLEDKNGYPSHDVRHLADNIQKTRAKITELNLDPDDTTGAELYHALLVKFQKDSNLFDAQNRIASQDFSSKSNVAIDLVSKNLDLPQRWVLKTAVAKNILRQHPPKKLLKQLKYRSLESMLKRESPAQLFLTAQFLESQNWQKELGKQVSKLDSSAFELRPVCIKYLAQSQWGLNSDSILAYDNSIGSLGLIEPDTSSEIPLLSIAILLADGLSNFGELDLSAEVAKFSPVLAWWSEMDGLIANLDSEHVSLNLSDISRSATETISYDNRLLDGARRSFWQKLLQRYDNQLEIEEDLLAGLKNKAINFNVPNNQPAFEYEYVEDI
ncbi:hypothetical protein KW801_00610 [Candidatus Saccharibacteria bacterium]|nr:hypothetical protein [Candidatus Saccharibacteria bacterium]